MTTSSNSQWTPNPFYYDFGRPFPGREVRRLLEGCPKAFALISARKSVECYEPGAGTGRILLPFAMWQHAWQFIGADLSASMGSVMKYKLICENVGNIHYIYSDIAKLRLPHKVDAIVISSLLHAVPDWMGFLRNTIDQNLLDSGLIFLIGEQADLYDCALGRRVDGADAGLLWFWEQYRSIRKALMNDELEASQVGMRWDIENTQATAKLLDWGFVQIDENTVEWQQIWSISALMKIVEERVYSSMFTTDDSLYAKLLHEMSVRISGRGIEESVISRHAAKVRCFAKSMGR